MKTCVLWASLLALVIGIGPSLPRARGDEKGRAVTIEAVRFEQTDPSRFIARSSRGQLFLDASGAVLATPKRALGLHVRGGRAVAPIASDLLATETHYYPSNDRSKWRTHVKNYGRVTYPGVLDGVDLVFHGDAGQLEYDFVVAPGVDARAIEMEIRGGDDLALAPNGDLLLGEVIQPRPRVFTRDGAGHDTPVPAAYRLTSASTVAFELGAYDRSRTLVIDPVVVWTYPVPRPSNFYTFAAASDGGSFIGGYTSNPSFPTTMGPAWVENVNASGFIGRVDHDGNLRWLSFYGGDASTSFVNDMAADGDGVLVTGSGSNLPTTADPVGTSGGGEVFASTFDRDGLLTSAVAIGGGAFDSGEEVARDQAGAIYIGGYTSSTDFPDSFLAAGDRRNNRFVLKLDASRKLVWSRTIGSVENLEGISSVTPDGAGSVYTTGYTQSAVFEGVATGVEGYDGIHFILKLDPAGNRQFVRLMRHDDDVPCVAFRVALDSHGTPWAVGSCYERVAVVPQGGGGMLLPYFGSVMRIDPLTGDTTSSFDLPGAFARDLAIDAFDAFHLVGEAMPAFVTTDGTAVPDDGSGGFYAALDKAGHRLFATASAAPNYGIAISSNGDRLLQANQYIPATGTTSLIQKVGPAVTTVTPAAVTTAANTTVIFTVKGDDPFATFALAKNASGGTIDGTTGAYTAGPLAGIDEVTATDQTGHVATATVTVFVPPPSSTLTLAGSAPSTTPRGSVQFVASGGSPPYLFVVASNASNGSIGPGGGYLAGARGNVTDTVRVTDSAGKFATATVNVGPGVTIDPASATLTAREKLQIKASGGAGGVYRWSATGGTIDTKGLFEAPPSAASVVVTATDSLGNKATADLSVGGSLAVSPSDATTYPRGTVQLTAFAGAQKGFNYVLGNASDATVDATGLYHAGPNGNVVDTVIVSDPNGNHAVATIRVGPALTISPATSNVASGTSIAFAVSGGSGAGYGATLSTNASGATVESGVYTSGPKGGTDFVVLHDSVGNEATASVVVTAPPPGASSSSGSTSSSSGGTTSSSSSGAAPTAPTVTVGGDDGGCSTSGGSTNASLLGVLFALGLAWRRKRETIMN